MIAKDLTDLKKFAQDRWLTLADVAELLVALCNEQNRSVDDVIKTGKLYARMHQEKEAA